MCFGNRHLWRLGRNARMEGLNMINQIKEYLRMPSAKEYLASFFGVGCVSVVLPKSNAVKFVDSIEAKLLSYSLI